jgi:hypothetical protein
LNTTPKVTESRNQTAVTFAEDAYDTDHRVKIRAYPFVFEMVRGKPQDNVDPSLLSVGIEKISLQRQWYLSALARIQVSLGLFAKVRSIQGVGGRMLRVAVLIARAHDSLTPVDGYFHVMALVSLRFSR